MRSDFTFYLESNLEIHVEVWGYVNKDSIHSREKAYYQKRIKKENLYKESNHILIGLDYEIFQGKYDDIQTRLYDIFNPYLKLKYKNVDQKLIIPSYKLTDSELLSEIMKFSKDDFTFPKQRVLTDNGVTGLYLEVINRHGSYYNFAEMFGKTTHYKTGKWNQEKIFAVFKYMIDSYGHLLMNDEIKNNAKDRKLTGIIENSNYLFGGLVEARFSFYEYCNEVNIQIPNLDMEYLHNLINCRRGFTFKVSTKERVERAKNIIAKCI